MATNSLQIAYEASMGLISISTANPNLNGSDVIETILTGSGNGTFVKMLIIKAQSNTSEGMVRVFAKKSSGGAILLSEFYVSPIIKSGRDLSYFYNIPLNYTLQSGEQLSASTQNAEIFNVIAEAFNISFLSNSTFVDSSLEYIANSGSGIINTANSNLDGSGVMTKILTAGGSVESGYKGCVITSIIIKAQETTIPGMIRLYVQDSSSGTPVLFNEVVVPSVVQAPTIRAFEHQVINSGSFCIPPGYSIWASTEQSNTFGVLIESSDWRYI